MAVIIIAEKAPAGSSYDQWKVYRATTRTGEYSVVNTQNLTDLTFHDTDGGSTHWYKISYYDSEGATESALSESQRGLSSTYTTVRHVQDFMRLIVLTDSTTPTIQQVVALINRKEDKIDLKTGHAWRERFSGTRSGQDMSAIYEYYDVPSSDGYDYQSGISIYLKHRIVRTFDTDKDDVIEIWNGSEWEDWTADKTEGRADDYWVDYEQGVLYLRMRSSYAKPRGLRIKYRYGEDTVNKTVEEIATKMVCIDLLSQDSKAVILSEGSTGMTHGQKVDLWQKQIDEDLNGLKEFQTMSVLT